MEVLEGRAVGCGLTITAKRVLKGSVSGKAIEEAKNLSSIIGAVRERSQRVGAIVGKLQPRRKHIR